MVLKYVSQDTVQRYHPALSVLSMLRLHRQLSSLKVDVQPFESQGFRFNSDSRVNAQQNNRPKGLRCGLHQLPFFIKAEKAKPSQWLSGEPSGLLPLFLFDRILSFKFVPLDAAVEEIPKARKLTIV
jgi:hypothetical protein